MLLRPILEVEIFDRWEIDFMRPFRLHIRKSIFLWRLIICPSELRLSLLGQTVVGRCSDSSRGTSSDIEVRGLELATKAHTSRMRSFTHY